VSLRLRPRAKPYVFIGLNIRPLAVRKVGGRRTHLVFCACRPSLNSSIVEPNDLCSTCSGCTSLSEESLESLAHAFPCVVDNGSEAACSEAASVGKPRKSKDYHIAFSDMIETIDIPLGDDCDFIIQVPQRCDGETTTIIEIGRELPATDVLQKKKSNITCPC
jgi:hypothetical protein